MLRKMRNFRGFDKIISIPGDELDESGAHQTLSKLCDVPVGFVTSLLISGNVFLYLRSSKDGCCSMSDDLSCSNIIICLQRWQNDQLIIERTIGLLLSPCTFIFSKKLTKTVFVLTFSEPTRPWSLFPLNVSLDCFSLCSCACFRSVDHNLFWQIS